MSTNYTNYLSSTGEASLRDYQHAKKLYLDGNYIKTPKVGFLYYVLFNINPECVLDQSWGFKNSKDVGLLVKRIDLPKFNITTETLNQYNRKTVVQTKLNYNPVTIEFHDDNQDITNNLWVNYYQFYYKDSNYGGSAAGEPQRNEQLTEFKDTKYKENNYGYGRYNYNNNPLAFFSTIDIYVMNLGFFTQYTLVNPKITDWQHDSLNQTEGGKILQNRMTLAYENVLYNRGTVTQNNPEGFATVFYDNTPSPNTIAGNPRNQPNYSRSPSAFDKPSRERVYGVQGGKSRVNNPLLDIASILIRNQINQKGLGRAKGVGYNMAGGVLGALGSAGAGKYSSPPPSQSQPGIFNLPGGVGINIFKGVNTTVDGKVRANPASIIFPKLGGGGG